MSPRSPRATVSRARAMPASKRRWNPICMGAPDCSTASQIRCVSAILRAMGFSHRIGRPCSRSWSSMSPCASVASAMTYASAGVCAAVSQSTVRPPMRRARSSARAGVRFAITMSDTRGSDARSVARMSPMRPAPTTTTVHPGVATCVPFDRGRGFALAVGRCSSLAGRGHSVSRSLRILERSKESACPPICLPTSPTSSRLGA